jgi:hypothetical protein
MTYFLENLHTHQTSQRAILSNLLMFLCPWCALHANGVITTTCASSLVPRLDFIIRILGLFD